MIGPLARSADDLALAMSVTAGPDAIDGAGWKLALPRARQKSLSEFRVAVLASHPTAEVDASVARLVNEVARIAAKRGAKVSHRARPDFDHDEAHRVYIQLLRFATSGRRTRNTSASWPSDRSFPRATAATAPSSSAAPPWRRANGRS